MSEPVLVSSAAALEAKQTEDPGFAEQVRAEWAGPANEQLATSGGVTNHISGQVSGNVVQARDIHGGVTFGSR